MAFGGIVRALGRMAASGGDDVARAVPSAQAGASAIPPRYPLMNTAQRMDSLTQAGRAGNVSGGASALGRPPMGGAQGPGSWGGPMPGIAARSADRAQMGGLRNQAQVRSTMDRMGGSFTRTAPQAQGVPTPTYGSIYSSAPAQSSSGARGAVGRGMSRVGGAIGSAARTLGGPAATIPGSSLPMGARIARGVGIPAFAAMAAGPKLAEGFGRMANVPEWMWSNDPDVIDRRARETQPEVANEFARQGRIADMEREVVPAAEYGEEVANSRAFFRDTSSATGWSYTNGKGLVKRNAQPPHQYERVVTNEGNVTPYGMAPGTTQWDQTASIPDTGMSIAAQNPGLNTSVYESVPEAYVQPSPFLSPVFYPSAR